MSDEIRMTLLHHSTNDLIEELLMWRGLAAERLDRITELEAAQRWIPVSEPPKECEMRVFKDGDAWCFVLPDFQDLQVSPSVWMKKGVLDKIYKELRSGRDE